MGTCLKGYKTSINRANVLSSSLILFLVLFEVNFSSAVQRLEVESIIMLKSRLSLTHFTHRLKCQNDLVQHNITTTDKWR